MAFSSPPAQGLSVLPGAGVFLSSKTFPHHQYRCFKYLFRATTADILSDIPDNIVEWFYFSSLCLSSMWHIFWRSIRPMFWRILLAFYPTNILACYLACTYGFYIMTFKSIWHMWKHSIWQICWPCVLQPTWQTFWHSIRHIHSGKTSAILLYLT